MVEQARLWVGRAAIGIAVGFALGIAIGWWMWPVTYTNTPPTALREDYRDEYILMTATAYEVEQDLGQARLRMERLDPEEPAAPVVELAGRLIQANGSRVEIARLARLARVLGVTDPALAPYVGG
jgi:hypothetical protein